jgi:methyl-accepting chemotaxis protein
MDQIGMAMVSINQAGSQNAGSLKQMEMAAKKLHELGQSLTSLVLQFKA